MAPNDTWNFAYVLPQFPPDMNIDEIDIVVPSRIKIGWIRYPAHLCQSSKTVRYISNEREITKIGSLLDNTLEEHIMPTLGTDLPHRLSMMQLTRWLIEVYVDDLIVMKKNLKRPPQPHR